MKQSQEITPISDNSEDTGNSIDTEGSEREVCLFEDGNKRRAVIYVWFDNDEDIEDFGHVALQTYLAYWSFWPRLKEEDSCSEDNMKTKTSYDQEVKRYNRPADICICLYQLIGFHLNDKVENSTGKEAERKKHWVSLNRNQLFAKPKGFNCYCIVADMLATSDQYNSYGLREKRRSGKFKCADVNTPEKLANLAWMMKKRELKVYPKTKKYHYVHETKVTKKCSIM